MTAERMTVKQWVHHLEAPDAQLTLSELMALCLLHIRENVKDGRLATQHTEGIMTTLDEALYGVVPGYAQVAAKRAQSAPMIPEQGVS